MKQCPNHNNCPIYEDPHFDCHHAREHDHTIFCGIAGCPKCVEVEKK